MGTFDTRGTRPGRDLWSLPQSPDVRLTRHDACRLGCGDACRIDVHRFMTPTRYYQIPLLLNSWQRKSTHVVSAIGHILANYVFGLVDIYNLLLAYVVSATSVSSFQKRLQEFLAIAMNAETRSWGSFFFRHVKFCILTIKANAKTKH